MTVLSLFFWIVKRLFKIKKLIITYQLYSGDERSRTADLFLAKEALYQLSYIPNSGYYKLKIFESQILFYMSDERAYRSLIVIKRGVFL